MAMTWLLSGAGCLQLAFARLHTSFYARSLSSARVYYCEYGFVSFLGGRVRQVSSSAALRREKSLVVFGARLHDDVSFGVDF